MHVVTTLSQTIVCHEPRQPKDALEVDESIHIHCDLPLQDVKGNPVEATSFSKWLHYLYQQYSGQINQLINGVIYH